MASIFLRSMPHPRSWNYSVSVLLVQLSWLSEEPYLTGRRQQDQITQAPIILSGPVKPQINSFQLPGCLGLPVSISQGLLVLLMMLLCLPM